MQIKTALLSVSDKTGIVDLARLLESQDIKILSTGGTSALLKSEGINVTDISDHTQSPEILNGRVKTLHPKIHAGILAKRNDSNHLKTLESLDITTIDLVVVNLYPFELVTSNPNCTFVDAIENIDIGGPAMIRAAAKNFGDSNGGVTVVVDQKDYNDIKEEIINNKSVSYKKRFQLAIKAYAFTSNYDGKIAAYFSSLKQDDSLFNNSIPVKDSWPDIITMQFHKRQNLRYGENSHQSAAFYIDNYNNLGTISSYNQIQGKELSYNNLADADSAWNCLSEFEEPACVIVKHANPCGVSIGINIYEAYKKSFSTDPISAFGGIIAFNRVVDLETAQAVNLQFLEVLIAPSYTKEALEILSTKNNIRVLQIPQKKPIEKIDIKKISGGLLLQDFDNDIFLSKSIQVVTNKKPTEQEMSDMLFANKVAKHVKSNAIVFTKDGMTLGIGAGQMSRVDSAKIASIKANNVGLSLKNSIAASDAFFPFRDALDIIVDSGAKCIIQPGGSIHDDEIISAANDRNIVMIMTGIRHFRH